MSRDRHLAVIYSDQHINNYKRFNNDNNDRLKLSIKPLFDIADFCQSKGIKTIFFVGDLYDTQKALLVEVVNETVKAFTDFAKYYPEITIYAISGNHDHCTKNLIDNPAISALEHIQTVCKNFKVIDNDFVEIDEGIIVHGIPYFEYTEHFDKALDKVYDFVSKGNVDDKNYLLIHQTPEGLGNAMIPTDTNPKDDRYGVFDHVFCGHIHYHKPLTQNFTIVGNPIHRDLADAGHKKGFLVMNLKAPENGFKFIPLKGYPEFVEVFQDEDIDEEDNYVVRKPRLDDIQLSEVANADDFNTSLKAQDLMENY